MIITLKTANLAKEKNCKLEIFGKGFEFIEDDIEYWTSVEGGISGEEKTTPVINLIQSELQKFIRENRGVHIEIYRNASGYYWGMCKSDGGTNLGWSEYSGPKLSGVWDSYEDALENALQTQLYTDLKQLGHWSNYAAIAIKNIKNGRNKK